MQGTLVTAVLGGMLLLFSLSSPLWARVDADEAQLETVRKDLDKDLTAKSETDKIQSLAKQFNVAPDVVQGLRAKKQGWGSVTIELAMAQEFSKTDPNTYPKLTDALSYIESLRIKKMGWGRIAKELGFKLGPVVSAAQHVRNEMRKDSRPVKSTVPKIEKPEKAAVRAEKPVRPERVSRPERPTRPERAARAH